MGDVYNLGGTPMNTHRVIEVDRHRHSKEGEGGKCMYLQKNTVITAW